MVARKASPSRLLPRDQNEGRRNTLGRDNSKCQGPKVESLRGLKTMTRRYSVGAQLSYKSVVGELGTDHRGPEKQQ